MLRLQVSEILVLKNFHFRGREVTNGMQNCRKMIFVPNSSVLH